MTTYNLTINHFDASGSPIVGAVIHIALNKIDYFPTGTVTTAPVVVTTDVNGQVIVPLHANTHGSQDSRYNVWITDPTTKVISKHVIQMPASSSNLRNLIGAVTVETPGAAAASASTAAVSAGEASVDAAAAVVSATAATTSATNAATSATDAATSATSAETSATTTAADAAVVAADKVITTTNKNLTATDAVATAADRTATNADVVITNQNKNLTAVDVITAAASTTSAIANSAATAADLVLTNADVVSTATNVATTVTNKNLTAADAALAATSASSANTNKNLTNVNVVLTNADVVLTQADAVSTAADAVTTNADVITTTANKDATLVNATSAAASMAASTTNKNLTAADVITTAADVVLTNADVVSSTANAATAVTNAAISTDNKNFTAADKSAASVSAAAAAADLVLTNADVVITNADVTSATAMSAAATTSAAAAAVSASEAVISSTAASTAANNASYDSTAAAASATVSTASAVIAAAAETATETASLAATVSQSAAAISAAAAAVSAADLSAITLNISETPDLNATAGTIVLRDSSGFIKSDSIDWSNGLLPTGSDIKTIYEAQSDTNAYTDNAVSLVTGVPAKINYIPASDQWQTVTLENWAVHSPATINGNELTTHNDPFSQYLDINGFSGRASTPNTAANSIRQTIVFEADMAFDNVSGASHGTILSKKIANNIGYHWWIRQSMILYLNLSEDGINDVQAASSIALPIANNERVQVKTTWDVFTKAVIFEYKTVGGAWTQLGTPVPLAIKRIYNSTTFVEVGSWSHGGGYVFAGKIYSASVSKGPTPAAYALTGSGSHLSTPNSVANSIRQSITIEVDVAVDNWAAGNQNFVTKSTTNTSNNAGWRLRTLGTSTGYMQLVLSSDGINEVNASVGPLGLINGQRYVLKAVWNAATQLATFYVDGVQQGSPVALAAASIYDSAADVIVGGYNNSSQESLEGKVYSVKVSKGPTDAAFVAFDGTATTHLSQANSDKNSIPGTIVIETDFQIPVVPPVANSTLISKEKASGGNRAWRLYLAAGTTNLALVLSEDGVATQLITHDIASVLSANVRLKLRVTVDLGTKYVTYESATGVDNAYVAIGSPELITVVRLFNSSADIEIGAYNLGLTHNFLGKIYSATVKGDTTFLPAAAFNWPGQTTLATITGDAPTFTRATSAVFEDFEGLIKTVASNEPRFVGARRVENLSANSENFSASSWTNNTVGLTAGVADPDGGTTAWTFTANNTTSYLVERALPVPVAGTVLRCSIWVRRRTGTGAVIVYSGGDNYAQTDISSSLTTEWQRFSLPAATTNGAGFNAVGVRVNTTSDEVDIWHPQMENVTGQSNKNPSEYVSTGVGTGSELVTNGDGGSTDDWSASRSNSTLSVIGGRLRATATASGAYGPVQTLSGLVVGSVYQAKVDIFTGGGSAQFYFRIVSSSNLNDTTPVNVPTTVDNSISVEFVATATTMYVGAINVASTGGEYLELDNISVKSASHGANIDGVQYFDTLNANAVSGNVVTEATGSALTAATTQFGELHGAGDYFSSPNIVTTWAGLDLRVRVTAPVDATARILVAKDGYPSTRSWGFHTSGNQLDSYYFESDGTLRDIIASGAVIPFAAGELAWFRLTINTTTGDCKYWTADGNLENPAISDYVQLGVTRNPAGGATSIKVTTDPFIVGIDATFTNYPYEGSFYRTQIFNTVDGITPLVDFTPGSYVSGSTLVSSTTSEVWTLEGNASIFSPSVDASGPFGYLAEKASTNLALQSEDFTTSWTIQGVAVTTDAAIAPDGTTTMDRLVVTTVSNYHAIFQLVGSLVATNYTASVYMKDDGAGFGGICFHAGNTAFVSVAVNLSTGVVTDTEVGSVSGTIVASGCDSVGNGIYRVWISGSVGGTGAYIIPFISNNGSLAANIGGRPTYAGVLGEDILLWGAQVELGTYPTSYIPTLATAVTRNGDVLLAPSNVVTSAAGTVSLEASRGDSGLRGAYDALFSFSGSNRILPRLNSSAYYPVVIGSGTGTVVSGADSRLNAAVKTTLTYSGLDVTLYHGAASASGTLTGAIPAGVVPQIGGLSNSWQNGLRIRHVKIFNNELTAAEVAKIADYGTMATMVSMDPINVMQGATSIGGDIGPELVTNGDFSNGIINWASGRGAALSYVNNILRITNGGGATSGTADQAITTVIGNTYTITAYVGALGGGATSGHVFVSTAPALTGVNMYASGNVVTNTTVTATFTATATTSYVTLRISGGPTTTSYVEFDNISVKEVAAPSEFFLMKGNTTAVSSVDDGIKVDMSPVNSRQGLTTFTGNLTGELGPDLVTNGDFSDGTTGWTFGTVGTFTAQNGQATITSPANTYYNDAIQILDTSLLQDGKTYNVTGTIVSATIASHVPYLSVYGSNSDSSRRAFDNFVAGSLQQLSFSYTYNAATDSRPQIRVYVGGQNGQTVFTNVSFREVLAVENVFTLHGNAIATSPADDGIKSFFDASESYAGQTPIVVPTYADSATLLLPTTVNVASPIVKNTSIATTGSVLATAADSAVKVTYVVSNLVGDSVIQISLEDATGTPRSANGTYTDVLTPRTDVQRDLRVTHVSGTGSADVEITHAQDNGGIISVADLGFQATIDAQNTLIASLAARITALGG